MIITVTNLYGGLPSRVRPGDETGGGEGEGNQSTAVRPLASSAITRHPHASWNKLNII